MYGININLMHIFIIGPLLFGIGYKEPGKNMNFYQYLSGMLVMLPFMLHFPKSKPSEWKKWQWNTVIHLLLFFPFLVYVVLKKDKSPEIIFNLLKIIGICVITTHIYLLAEKVIKKFKSS